MNIENDYDNISIDRQINANVWKKILKKNIFNKLFQICFKYRNQK